MSLSLTVLAWAILPKGYIVPSRPTKTHIFDRQRVHRINECDRFPCRTQTHNILDLSFPNSHRSQNEIEMDIDAGRFEESTLTPTVSFETGFA